MTMKRLCATVLLLLLSVCAFAVQKSGTIVYINGSKFYIHTVQPGETLYGLSKAYEVGEKVILQYNPSAGGGLKAGENVKIPFVTAVPEPKSERKLRRTFDSHTVAQGETLYAISRKYEIPIQTVIEDNPSLDPTNLRLGERILIRKKEIGSEDEAGAKEQWEAYRNTLNSVAEEGYAYHMVKPGETFYSLSRRFGITEEQLGSLNGGLKPADLKAGAIIKVPGSPEELAAGERQPADTVRADSVPDLSADNRVKEIEFRALRRSATLNVALMLPIAVDGDANSNYLEFYQGFLLGLDSVKTKSGYSMNVCLYNTARDAEKIREITESDAFRNTDLIIGPVYEEGLYPVIRFAEEHNVPVVSPLANITGMNSDVLFQMAPDPAHKWEKAAELVNGDRQVTLIYTESTDKEFEKEILTLLGDSDYKKHTYKYVHPSARTNSNSGDLTPLLDNGADNVFIVMSDNEVDVDRILAAIASADTNISSRGRTAPPVRRAGQYPLEPHEQHRPHDVLQGPRDLHLDLPRQARLADDPRLRQRLYPLLRVAAHALLIPRLRCGGDLLPRDVQRHRVRHGRPELHAPSDLLSLRTGRGAPQPRQPQLDESQLQQRLHDNRRIARLWHL